MPFGADIVSAVLFDSCAFWGVKFWAEVSRTAGEDRRLDNSMPFGLDYMSIVDGAGFEVRVVKS